MTRSRLIFALFICSAALFVPTSAHAQQMPCNLSIVVSCTNGHCTSVTTNNGTNACTGLVYLGFEVMAPVASASLTGFTSGMTLPECFDSSTFPGAGVNFAMCFGPGGIPAGASVTSSVNVTTTAGTASPPVLGFTEVIDDKAGELLGLAYAFSNAGVPTCTPTATVAAATLSGVAYNVTWTPVIDPAATYIVEESTSADFSTINNSISTPANTYTAQFQHTVSANTTYFYRVRAASCSGSPGTNSAVVSIIIQPPPPPTSRGTDVVVPFGTSAPFVFPTSVQLPLSQAGFSFTASVDKPYYSVSPSSGTVPPNGLLSLTITADPKDLPPGANTGTLTVTTKSPGPVTNLDATTTSVPISVSLVTPVTPGGKSLPPLNALIIPVVTHVVGSGNTPFVSDVRLTNGSASPVQYQVSYTPANTDGTQNGKITNVTVAAGQTIALNDIVKDFFGIGVGSDTGSGALEIRPVNSSATTNYSASRTYAVTPNGTYGQFIAAIPFSQFATAMSLVPGPTGGTQPTGPAPILSIQHVAQSPAFRTNLGMVEASGTPANGNINFYDDSGTKVATVPFSLQPGEQQQKSLASLGVTSLDDGRIEIQVTSVTGAVSAYASVLDNKTSDPLAVTPVVASAVHASHYVVPGVSEFIAADGRNFHSDVRVFNGAATPANVTLTFYGGAAPVSAPPFTLAPGQVKRLDDVLTSFFGVARGANVGGSIVATTAGDSSLVLTGRTYSNAAGGGTFGQFIPGVTAAQGIALGDRPLEILQLEQSSQFRSNIGVAETSGAPVDGKITLIQPDSKVAPVVTFHLEGNQFAQFGNIINSMLGSTATVYNARVMVEVTGGTGRLTAYGSVIDNLSTDPTYVPAQ